MFVHNINSIRIIGGYDIRMDNKDNIKLTGRIISTSNGSEASLIIPIGDYKIMILSDDNLGAGEGFIQRSEISVYYKDDNPSDNINEEVFGKEFVIADTETLFEAMQYCQMKLRKKLRKNYNNKEGI